MAIYYINPHTSTNGTGTFASPWSFSTNLRTGLTHGDEIRVLGVALTDLLTATSYTATVVNQYQLTITAGGGLGADWAAADIAYLPAFDTFFRVYSVSSNTIQLYTTSSILPITDFSTTSVTLRKVNVASYPASTTSTGFVTGGPTEFNNITVSDCWIDATTRVTDGSVKTLIQSTSAQNLTYYADITTNSGKVSGWTVNLQNTHVICSRATTNGQIDATFNGSSSTYNIKQLYSWGTGGQGIVQSNAGVDNTTINITTLNNAYGLGATCFYGQNNTINVTNLITSTSNIFGINGGIRSPNNTVNITNYSLNTVSQSAAVINENSCHATVNITGVIDQFGNTTPNSIVAGYGGMTLNIGSGVVYYFNKRASTKTAFSSRWVAASTGASGELVEFGQVNISNGWTFIQYYDTASTLLVNYPRNLLPQNVTLRYENNSISSYRPNLINGVNLLLTFKDGSSPVEILSPYGAGIFVTNNANNFAAKVTTDSSVYRTTGPSLKSFLETRLAGLWGSPDSQVAKTIKIPCTASTSYTVSGYIQTDETAYVDGDCRVSIFLNGEEVTGQDMTTACENAWEGFTLTFTASTTAEYVFVWKMYYANGNKSYWLDDLTIS